MSTIVIVGTDSVAGYNLALEWSPTHRVCGISLVRQTDVPGVACGTVKPELIPIRETLSDLRATHVVFAGACDKSAWDRPDLSGLKQDADHATRWAKACAELEIQFSLLSSDGVFTGPWIFHGEDCESHCESAEARVLRSTENQVLNAHPDALVIRCNPLGWGPDGRGWATGMHGQLENEGCDFDCIAHATPIFVGHLAETIEQCWQQDVRGTWHAASTERVNPMQVARRLAGMMGLKAPTSEGQTLLSCRPSSFGAGESSLDARELCRQLGSSVSSLEEGLQSFLSQRSSLLAPAAAGPVVRVA